MCKVRAKEREEIKSENERTWQLLIANGQQITRIAEAAEKMIPPVYQYEITNNTVTK